MAIYRCPICDRFVDDDEEIGTDLNMEDLVCPDCVADQLTPEDMENADAS